MTSKKSSDLLLPSYAPILDLSSANFPLPDFDPPAASPDGKDGEDQKIGEMTKLRKVDLTPLVEVLAKVTAIRVMAKDVRDCSSTRIQSRSS
jgi:hypothetical protein